MVIRVISMLNGGVVSDEFMDYIKSIRGVVIVANRLIRKYGLLSEKIDAIFVTALIPNKIKYIDMFFRLTDGMAVRKKIYYDSSGRSHCCCYEEKWKN